MKYFFGFAFTIIQLQVVSQKLPFQNYGVQNGLIQSQVLSITQDKQQHLWIGTLSGLDRFDGSNFIHYTKKDGINSAISTCLFTASDGKIWIGTFEGISCFNGKGFINYAVEGKSENSFFINIEEDQAGILYAYSQKDGLYQFSGNKFIRTVPPFQNAIVTCLFKNTTGEVLACFQHGEFYKLNKGNWKKDITITNLECEERILLITAIKDKFYGLSSKGQLLQISGNAITLRQKINATLITNIRADNDGNIWIGTNSGVQVFESEHLTLKAQYNASAGLSNNIISKIYKDIDGSMWIASDGDGLFRFSGELFSRYDNSNGLNGNVVMGFAEDGNGTLYIGTREGGMVKLNTTDKKLYPVNYSGITKAGINCITNDLKGNIYLGTMDSRLLKYDGKVFSEIILDAGLRPSINTIVAANNKIWIAASTGCYYIKEDRVKKLAGLNEIDIGVLPLDDSTILVNGMKGATEYHLNGQLKKIKLFQNTEILFFAKHRQYILVGTVDEGLLFWNKASGKIDTCDVSDGLSDNRVFSAYNDSKNHLWVGTGTGLQQVKYNEAKGTFKVHRFTQAEGYEHVESGMNSIIEDEPGQIWIGTTKGAFRYNAAAAAGTNTAPYVVIQSVTSESQEENPEKKNSSVWDNLPLDLTLPYNNSGISFTVKGISFKDPNSVTYAYQLVGADIGFAPPVNQPVVSYKNLEPGTYTFRVKAYNGQGIVSSNIAEYSFSVSTPFYKTTWFKILGTLSLVLIGVLLQVLYTKAKQKRARQSAYLRLKEQEQIRLRTSEDFHDELGNKLTRISLLTDILQKKINPSEEDKINIIKHIKESADALYGGTKDIIWSLSPGSDNLQKILKHIQQFGHELFNESSIEFEFNGIDNIDNNISLPMDYSRNLVMICKELLTNALRHSYASKVHLQVSRIFANEVVIELTDDGTGFKVDGIKKGNGLNNINRRAERINGSIQVQSGQGNGTSFTLKIKIPPKA